MEHVDGRVWIEGLNPWCELDAKPWKSMFNLCTIATLLFSLAVPVALLVFLPFSLWGTFQFKAPLEAVGPRPPHFLLLRNDDAIRRSQRTNLL